MPESSSTAIPEAAKATSTVQPPVQDINVAAEKEGDRNGVIGDRMVRAIGGGSPEASPSQFTGALGQLGGSSQVGMLRGLQRSYGNGYVGEVIQAKLTVGQPGDVYEQEADRVADTVMQMSEATVSGVPSHSNSIQPMQIQRMCTECAEEEEEKIHTKESPGQTPMVTPALEARLDGTRGGGEPLPESVRSYMEPRFGVDFSGVRVHTGSEADALNRELGAQAFTQQRDIYFGAGRYSSDTRDGQRLLAHELTHVVQQNQVSSSTTVKTASTKNAIYLTTSNVIQRQDDDSGQRYSDEMTERGRRYASRQPPPRSTRSSSTTTEAPQANLPSLSEAYWEPESMSRYVAAQTQELLRAQGWVETSGELWTDEFLETSSDEVKGDALRRIRNLIRLNAIRIMGSHREQVLRNRDRDLNAARAEQEGNTLGSVSETVSTLRMVARNIQELQQRRERLESYENGLERLSRVTYLGSQSASESLNEMGEYVSEYMTEPRRTALRESFSRTPRRERIGWIFRTALELREWRQEQIDGVSLALGELYTNFPFFAELDIEEALGGRYEEEAGFRLAVAEAYNRIMTAINISIREMATDDIDPYDLPIAVEGVKQALPSALGNLLDEAIRDRQSEQFWLSLGLTALEIALIFIPVVGPALSAALGVATFAMDAESLMDRAVIEEASANPERNVLGVQSPSAFEITMLGVQAALVAVDLGGIVSALRGVPIIVSLSRSGAEIIDATDEAVSIAGRTERALSSEADDVAEAAGRREARELLDEAPSIDEAIEEIHHLEIDSADFSVDIENSILDIPVHDRGGNRHTWRLTQDGWCRYSHHTCYISQRVVRAIEAQLTPGRLASRLMERYAGRLRGPETREALAGICRRVLGGLPQSTYSIAELRTIHRYLTEESNIEYVEILLPRGRRGDRTPDLAVHYTQHRPWASDAHSARLIDRIEVRTVAPSRLLDREAFVDEVVRGIQDKIIHRQLGSEIRGARRIPPEGGLAIEIPNLPEGSDFAQIADDAISRLLRYDEVRTHQEVRFIELTHFGQSRRYTRGPGRHFFRLSQ